MSHETLVARPHATEASPKIAVPATYVRRRPNLSPNAPPIRMQPASTRAKASITHCASSLVARSWRWMTGSATLTTVESTNAMLEPTTVVATIQPRARADARWAAMRA